MLRLINLCKSFKLLRISHCKHCVMPVQMMTLTLFCPERFARQYVILLMNTSFALCEVEVYDKSKSIESCHDSNKLSYNMLINLPCLILHSFYVYLDISIAEFFIYLYNVNYFSNNVRRIQGSRKLKIKAGFVSSFERTDILVGNITMPMLKLSC